MSKTYCPIPWVFQAVRNNGDLRLCCQANISEDQGLLFDENGKTFNASIDSLTEARNAENLKKIRLSMLKGEWSSSCQRCQQEESAGLDSRRQYEQGTWGVSYEQALEGTQPNGSIDTEKFPVKYYDLRFGNLCNLKCRMCGPTDSSAWYDDWVQLIGDSEFNDTHGIVKLQKKGDRYSTVDYDWHSSENFWKQIESNLPGIQYVYMAGGEPLLIKRHYDFLKTAIDRGFSKKMALEYNTNATQLPKKVLALWEDFKEIRIGASIDGYGKVFEYQRHPAKWPEVYDNLVKIAHLPDNVVSWLAVTVTVYNIFHLADFMKWKLQEDKLKNMNRTKKRPIITPHMAHSPLYLNIRSLPHELKEIATNRLLDFIDWIEKEDFDENTVNQGKELVKSIVTFMNSKSHYMEEWFFFIHYTKNMDRIRDENILDIVPEFANHLCDKGFNPDPSRL